MRGLVLGPTNGWGARGLRARTRGHHTSCAALQSGGPSAALSGARSVLRGVVMSGITSGSLSLMGDVVAQVLTRKPGQVSPRWMIRVLLDSII